jgi:protein gp37
MESFFHHDKPQQNFWLGVTVENREHGLPRLENLRRIPAAVRFISAEPLLENLGFIELNGIQWVIVGGESGPKARPMKKEWALQIKRLCEEQRVAFFFKQWGNWGSDGKKRSKKLNGRLLEGRIWNAYPQLHNPAPVPV